MLEVWVLQVILQDQVEVEGEDSEAITAYLEQKVERMIQTANDRAVAGRDAMLPLIRLRVSCKLHALHLHLCTCSQLLYTGASAQVWHSLEVQ